MSKRLIRISSESVYPSLETLLKVEINAVMNNGHTIFGKLESFHTGHILLRDKRDHLHSLQLAELYEIVYDA